VSIENILGLARVVRSNSLAALESMPLWHERAISHSSKEDREELFSLDYHTKHVDEIFQRVFERS